MLRIILSKKVTVTLVKKSYCKDFLKHSIVYHKM